VIIVVAPLALVPDGHGRSARAWMNTALALALVDGWSDVCLCSSLREQWTPSRGFHDHVPQSCKEAEGLHV